MEFRVDDPEPYIPDHLTLPQFVWDNTVVTRPRRFPETPYFIEEATGRKISEDEVGPTTPGNAEQSPTLGTYRPSAGVTHSPRHFESSGALVSLVTS